MRKFKPEVMAIRDLLQSLQQTTGGKLGILGGIAIPTDEEVWLS